MLVGRVRRTVGHGADLVLVVVRKLLEELALFGEFHQATTPEVIDVQVIVVVMGDRLWMEEITSQVTGFAEFIDQFSAWVEFKSTPAADAVEVALLIDAHSGELIVPVTSARSLRGLDLPFIYEGQSQRLF